MNKPSGNHITGFIDMKQLSKSPSNMIWQMVWCLSQKSCFVIVSPLLLPAAVGPPSKVDLAPAGSDLDVFISDPLTSTNSSMKEKLDQMYYLILYSERSGDTQVGDSLWQTLGPFTQYCAQVTFVLKNNNNEKIHKHKNFPKTSTCVLEQPFYCSSLWHKFFCCFFIWSILLNLSYRFRKIRTKCHRYVTAGENTEQFLLFTLTIFCSVPKDIWWNPLDCSSHVNKSSTCNQFC